jgi:hypothetical protein
MPMETREDDAEKVDAKADFESSGTFSRSSGGAKLIQYNGPSEMETVDVIMRNCKVRANTSTPLRVEGFRKS